MDVWDGWGELKLTAFIVMVCMLKAVVLFSVWNVCFRKNDKETKHSQNCVLTVVTHNNGIAKPGFVNDHHVDKQRDAQLEKQGDTQ